MFTSSFVVFYLAIIMSQLDSLFMRVDRTHSGIQIFKHITFIYNNLSVKKIIIVNNIVCLWGTSIFAVWTISLVF